MAQKLKVWSGFGFPTTEESHAMGLPTEHGRQRVCLVAATSQKRAAELVAVSVGYFRDYWSLTGNAVELSVATAEGVWFAPTQGVRSAEDYRRAR